MNNWGIPPWMEETIRKRDTVCVYCGIPMLESVPRGGSRKSLATWEHIINDASIVTLENIARCCNACNASKGAKPLAQWLNSPYCKRHGITKDTVADLVKSALRPPEREPPVMDSLILGLESSCDETSGAILKNGTEELASFISSQVDLHRRFGGVVPEVACRAHMECLLPGVQKLFEDAGVTPDELDAIAVTNRPGLIGALLVGLTAAKSLALAWKKPLLGVNHIEGHIAAARLAEPDLEFPFVALVVSGGHTNLYHVPAPDTYTLRGRTLDDAAGEAFDKAAKLLDLGFPGGPVVEKAARGGNPDAYPWKQTCLPKNHPLDFSFSGIKTAVLYAARSQAAGRKGPLLLDEKGVQDVAASFQHAVVHALVTRTLTLVKETGVKWIALGGGVAANGALREAMQTAAEGVGCRVAIPPMRLCTDNAVMIAARGAERFARGEVDTLELGAAPRGEHA